MSVINKEVSSAIRVESLGRIFTIFTFLFSNVLRKSSNLSGAYSGFNTSLKKESRSILAPTIPVQKFHGMMAILSGVSLLALLYACWGDTHLPAQSIPSLWQIMGAVLVLCALVFWTSILESSRKIFRRFNVKREGLMTFLSAFVITVPFLYVVYAQKNTPRALKDMY